MKNPIAILEQFVQSDGRRFSYMIEFLGHRDYWGPLDEAIVLFKVYPKTPQPKRPANWLMRLFDFGKYRRYKKLLGKTMTASQQHNK